MFDRWSPKFLVVLALILGAVALSAGIAVAAGSDDGVTAVSEQQQDEAEGAEGDDAGEKDDADESIGSEAATKAAEAALAAAGGGEVVAVESDDDGAGYEVEIRPADGSDVEVELDKGFSVVQREDD